MSLDKILKYTHFYLIKKLNFFCGSISNSHASRGIYVMQIFRQDFKTGRPKSLVGVATWD